jgi:hypothetical protein
LERGQLEFPELAEERNGGFGDRDVETGVRCYNASQDCRPVADNATFITKPQKSRGDLQSLLLQPILQFCQRP